MDNHVQNRTENIIPYFVLNGSEHKSNREDRKKAINRVALA